MKTSPLRSQAYLAFVRAHPCCVCGALDDIHAHHHGRREGGGGMGVKTCDLHTVPLCPSCHQQWHQKGAIKHPSTERHGVGTHRRSTYCSRDATEALLWKAIAVLMREALLRGLLPTVLETRVG